MGTWLRGKYRLDSLLGIGGMAAVYKATHRNKARLAIKMLHPVLSANEDMRQRFLREGYAANSVAHPGVVAIVDDDVAEDGSAFLVMELLEGINVEDMLERTGAPLPAGVVCAIGTSVLDVLEAAHDHGVLHRDIKPANIFVTTEGRVKVLDFGIARVNDAEGVRKTTTGATFGTPAFMAPEQACGMTSEIDARTDVWAVGATLYDLLANGTVHTGDNGQQVIVRAATKPAAPLATRAPGVRPALAAVVDRAVAFDPAARWQSASEMRDALRSVARTLEPSEPLAAFVARVPTGEPGAAAEPAAGAHPEEATTRGMSSDKRVAPRAVALGAAIGVAALAVVASLTVLRLRKPSPHTSSPAVTTTAPATISLPTVELTASVVAPPPTTSVTVERHPPPLVVHRHSSSRSVNDCDPSYTVDAKGNKHFKPECFTK